MTIPVDPTNSMPASSPSMDLGSALHSAMNGRESPTTLVREEYVPENPTVRTSNMQDIEMANERAASEEPSLEALASQDEAAPVESAPVFDGPEVELKVKGYKDLQKVKLDPNDDSLKSLIGKGMRFDKAMQELSKQKAEVAAQIEKYQDYESKSDVASKVAIAQDLISKGYGEHALRTILGEGTEDFISDLVSARIQYENANPEERLQLDLNREKRNDQLARANDADKIAKLEARLDARSESIQEAEYSGYVEDARGRYDLSQWVDDSDTASGLNDMLHRSAMSDILQLQKQREAQGLGNITQRDIRRAYAQRAKILISGHESQSSKIADSKITAQTEVAAKNAQVASTKNYGQSDVVSDWKKSGGSMSDLVDMMSRGSKIR